MIGIHNTRFFFCRNPPRRRLVYAYSSSIQAAVDRAMDIMSIFRSGSSTVTRPRAIKQNSTSSAAPPPMKKYPAVLDLDKLIWLCMTFDVLYNGKDLACQQGMI